MRQAARPQQQGGGKGGTGLALPVRQKVLAYLVRFSQGRTEVAVFDHVDAPEAGAQVPAGSIEAGESPEQACLREVAEESGVSNGRILRSVGVYDYAHATRGELHRRHVFLVAAPPGVPDAWIHRVSGPGDDRGLAFRFFWLEPGEAVVRLAGHQGAYLEQAVMGGLCRTEPQGGEAHWGPRG